MKNLKKVLALVVALTMVLGTVCFAFTDVTAESDVYTAVQTLSSLEILKGYEDGTFGPEKDITRSEFAAVVCRALGMESSANGAKGATQFADVPADHWASGYINLAAGQGIINGYGNGNFGPDDNVTYEQAVKMLVVALGYEPMAAQKGGYPTGYLVVANTYGMTKGVVTNGDAAAANRGMVAQLTYNALDIPVMEQTGFGTNVEYTIQDGTNNKDYKTLLTGLEVAKLEGSVTGTAVIGGTNLEPNYVEYKISEANDNEYWEKWLLTNTSGNKAELSFAEGVNAADYFGIASIVYAKEIKANKWEIIAIMPGEDSAIVELDKGDIDFLAYDNTNKVLEYYETDAATKTTKLKLAATGITVIVNNVVKDVAYVNSASVSDDAEIMVIENTGDSSYDMIVVKDYGYSVVEEVEADRDRFTTKDLRRFAFDFEDETIVNNIVNKDGEAITLADFAEGDVIAYILEDGNKTSDFAWIEIINLGQNVVTGTVTETNGNDDTIYVDGVEYEVTSNIDIANGDIKVNDEGTFFISATGKVFLFDLDASVASNYAYILDADMNTSAFTNGWQFKLLTKEGDITIFDVKDSFTVNGSSKNKADATIGGLEVLKTDKDIKANVNVRLITYKLDANNKIREINTVSSSAVGSTGNGVEYNGNSGAIANKVLEDDAVIFNITDTDADDAFVTTVGSLVHENKYVGHIVMNSDNEYDAFIITEGAGAIDYTQDIAIIESVNSITLDDDDAWKVRYYTANETDVKELTLTTETDVDAAVATKVNSTFANGLVIGTAFMFTAGDDGVVTNIAVVATPNNSTADTGAAYTENAYVVGKINADEDLEFIAGYIVDFTNSSKGVNIKFTGTREGSSVVEELLPVTAATNAFTYYNRTSSKISIVAGDWRGANEIDKAIDNKATFFFAVAENGIASDIVTFSARKALS